MLVKKYALMYLGVKIYGVCNLLSNVLSIITMIRDKANIATQ